MPMRRLCLILLPVALCLSLDGWSQAPDAARDVHAKGEFRDCPDCPEMVTIPAGKFVMGSSPEEKAWAGSHGGSAYAVADEAPQHTVTLKSFALGKYDVT